MAQQGITIYRRHMPHWRFEGSAYFVTFRLRIGTLSANERTIVLDHIRSGDGRFYWLLAATVMPDHVHVMIRPNEGYELSRITKGIKGVSARLINRARKTTGEFWQPESWDRIIRDEAEMLEKLHYILNNSVKRGLATDPMEYAATFFDLEPPAERR